MNKRQRKKRLRKILRDASAALEHMLIAPPPTVYGPSLIDEVLRVRSQASRVSLPN